jgi:hypothetical protein
MGGQSGVFERKSGVGNNGWTKECLLGAAGEKKICFFSKKALHQAEDSV